MPRAIKRERRISLRLSPQAKSRLERAAAYSHTTLTDFVVGVALEKAEAIVEANEMIALNSKEWARFQKLLLGSGRPNDRLLKALSERARVVRS